MTDDKIDDRYTILAGTNYVSAIKTVLGSTDITKINIENSTLTLPVARDWEPGTTKLALVNDLLSSLNYIPLYVDEQGFYTSRKYVSPLYRAVDYTYADDEFSVMFNGLKYGLDIFNTPNKFVRYTSNPDGDSLRSEYINDNPLSQLSTVRRGRTIPDILKVNDIADQDTLDDLTAKVAFEASQKYGKVKVSTATMPMHSHDDLICINNSKLGIYGNFVEINWSMPNETGAKMTHVLRKVVTI